MKRRKLMGRSTTFCSSSNVVGGSLTSAYAALLSSSSSAASTSSFLFVSSFSAAATIVVAFDVTVLSNALESFVTKGGGRNSFDLFICLPFTLGSMDMTEPGGKLEDVLILNRIAEYRAVLLQNCSQIQPQLPKDYNQILYLIVPDNKTVVWHALHQISQFYHMIKRTFYSSSPVGKLLWMPLFLVVWPDLEDYCGNDTTTEKLIRAFFHQPTQRRRSSLTCSTPFQPPPPPLNNSWADVNNNSNNTKCAWDAKEVAVVPAGDKNSFSLSSAQSFSVNSDVYFYFGKECEGSRDNVWEVYNLQDPAGAGEIIVQKLTPDGRKHESMFEGILGRVRRRRNLRQTVIRAVASKDPSSFLVDPPPGSFNPLEIVNGTPHVVFTEMRRGLNFSMDLIIGDWIRKHSNGTLKGTTVTLFRKGMVDLTISLTSLLPYRKVELSFLQPTYSDSVNGFFVQPAASSFRDIVIASFSLSLWLSLLITYLIIVASILCFGKVYRKVNDAVAEETEPSSVSRRLQLPCQESPMESFTQGDSTFEDELLLWAVGAMTQKGWHICPDSNSTRMAFLLGYFLGLVCYGAFSAAVVSILAVELIPIATRSDLLNSSLTFYADDASSTMAYIVNHLRNSTQVRFGRPVNIQQGVNQLQKNAYEPSCYLAFPQYFYLSAVASNISQSWICDKLSVIPVTTVATPSSMVVPRNSEYAELFNFVILKMIGRGLNYRYVHLYREVTSLKCSDSLSSSQVFHPLGYSDMFTAFMIVFMGAMAAVALVILERVWIFFQNRTTNDTPEAVTDAAVQNELAKLYENWMR